MDKKIKVLWVTNTVAFGGAERQLMYMYDILQTYGNYEITIMYYAKAGDELRIDGVRTVFIDKAKIGKVNMLRQMVKYIKDNDIDIVHAFGGNSANIYGRIAAAFCKKAVPVGAVLGKKHFANKGVALVNSALNLFGNWWTVNNLELIPILKRDLAFVSDKKVRMLHNGFIPADKIDYQTGVHTDYDEDKQDNFVFTVVGRLEPVKNYPLFLKAAQRIAKNHDKVRFWVIGNGKEMENLQTLAKELGIEEKVRFWGYRTDVDTAMSRTDVFVQTSFTEGSPNTVAEAMRASKPVVTTRSTDFSEMVIPGENGYVVESDDLDGLTQAMEAMLERNPEELEKAGKVSYELFEKYFLDVRVAAEFKAFYNEILGK